MQTPPRCGIHSLRDAVLAGTLILPHHLSSPLSSSLHFALLLKTSPSPQKDEKSLIYWESETDRCFINDFPLPLPPPHTKTPPMAVALGNS